MGKYTVTLNYLLKNNIPIWTFEEKVATYFDEYFTQDKWNYLKALFELKYLFEEIGNETIELWQHYLELSFTERIHTYKKLLATYSNMEGIDPFSEYESNEQYEGSNADLPYSNTGTLGNLSNIQKYNRTGQGRNTSAIDIYDNYARKIRDLDDEFVDGFRHNFMEVY